MEGRKIQKAGAGTLTLSLPREWASRRRLKKGDPVFLIQEGEQLRVIPANSPRKPAPRSKAYVVDADACDMPGLLEHVIVGNYILGRQKIVVRASGKLRPEHVEEAHRAARRLLGLAITEQSAQEIVLQCALEAAEYPLDSLLRRMQDIGATMLTDAIEALVTRDKRLARDAATREAEADTIHLVILRHLLSAQLDDSLMAELGLPSRLSLAEYHMVTLDLEEITDCSEEIARAVEALLDRRVDIDSDFARQLREYAELAVQTLREAMDGLFAKPLEELWPVFHREEEFERREQDLVRLKLEAFDDPRDILPLRTVLRGVRRIGEFVQDIALAVVDHHLAHAAHRDVATEVASGASTAE